MTHAQTNGNRLHQVEFLLEGYILPATIGRIQITDTLVLEQVFNINSEYPIATIAYVGVVAPNGVNFFPNARDYLDFFLLTFCLVSGHTVIETMGIGTTLDDFSSLGTKRVGFPSFEKIDVLGEYGDYKNDPLSEPILAAKERFLLLLPERQKIMESPLGLSLIYYYFAVRASKRLLEESIIHLMIAAEALLIKRSQNIRESLSRRLSVLIAKNDEERVEISKKMRGLYDLRSAIVHGGGKKPSWIDVQTLAGYIRRAIEEGISLRQLSKKQLLDKLDQESVDCNKNAGWDCGL